MSTTRYSTRRDQRDRWYVDDSYGGTPFHARTIQAHVVGSGREEPLSEAEAHTIAVALNGLHQAAGSARYICSHGINRYYVDCGACGDYGDTEVDFS